MKKNYFCTKAISFLIICMLITTNLSPMEEEKQSAFSIYKNKRLIYIQLIHTGELERRITITIPGFVAQKFDVYRNGTIKDHEGKSIPPQQKSHLEKKGYLSQPDALQKLANPPEKKCLLQ